jgi:hypothetical protein
VQYASINHHRLVFKGIGSILFLRNSLKKSCRKNRKMISEVMIDYEVCTAIARCFPNILDVIWSLEIQKCLTKKYGHRHDGLMKQTWISVISRLHKMSAVYISTALEFHRTLTLKCLISVRKLHALTFSLFYEFNSVHANLLLLKRDGQIYFVIIIISSVFIIILQNL